MTASIDVIVLGVRVRIDLDPGLDEQQRQCARRSWSGALSSGPADAELRVLLEAGPDFQAALEQITVTVTLAALQALRGRALMFHAAGVADAEGRVAAFVGPSGRGKTTLSRVLGRHYAYVSDETIAVDPDLAVHPYRKPLSVVREGAPKEQISPVDAGLQPLPESPLRLAALVLIDRDPSLSAPEIVPIPLAVALPELVPQMSYLRDQHKPLQSIAALCDATGGVLLLRYPDASVVPPLMSRLLDRRAARSSWSPVADAIESGPFSIDGVKDAIVTGDHVLVMAGSTVHLLDGIAPTVWLAAAAGCDLDAIVLAVEARFGPPPDGDAHTIVSAAIDELAAVGVIERRERSPRRDER